MRKLIVLSLVTFLCLSSVAYAASIGGAETQGQGKVGIGLDQEFVFDRDMKVKSTGFEADGGETFELKTGIDKMYRTMVKTSYGLFDGLDVYIKLGTADFESKSKYTWRDTATGDWDIGNWKMKGDNAFAYGFGMKGKYEFENDWFIGCDVQYLTHKNDFKGTDSWEDSDGDSDVESIKGEVTFQEWQIAPYVAKRIGNFIPYFGIKYSDLRQKHTIKWEGDPEGEKVKTKADDNVGVFVGTDYKINDAWSLNLEGRFIDETAISLACGFKF
ncbi:MAG: outer membrane beta-barrel protein [Candidatus Omnitrophica bacterium]|nr:outer membrane beta-barrel protein [Candidatus Omnitrophota bacterium]MBU1523764.1 outer membrane beta-barrel protein [Candidatus Omnitrophota bacterium]